MTLSEYVARLESKVVREPEINAEIPQDWFHAGQLKVWNSEATDIVACAGAQGGKTATSPYWLLREIQRCAPLIRELGRGNFIYAGPTMQLLDAQAIPAFEAYYADELRLGRLVKGGKQKFHFSEDGARRLVGFPVDITVHFAYTNDSQNLESMTALAGVWDEAGQRDNKEASFEAFNRRLKIARSRGYGRRLFATTPYEWGWFKRRVVDQATQGKHGFEYFNWPSWLNPMVSESECRAELDAGMDDWRWRMMYLGEWTRPAGSVYDCFDSRVETDLTGPTNVVKPFEIPNDAHIHLGWDFGSANTASVAVFEMDGVWYVANSYHAPGDDEGRHIARVREKAGRKEASAWGGSAGEDHIRGLFKTAGMHIRKPPISGSDSVMATVMILYRAIKQKKLKVFSNLGGLISELETISYVMDGHEDPTERIQDKERYHRHDALRYVMCYLARDLEIKRIGGRYDRETLSKRDLYPLGSREY